MSFVPPQFGNFGKSVKDLFGKKYDTTNQVATKHKASNGVTVEAGGVGEGSLTGFFKLNYKNNDFGDVDVAVNTKGAAKAQTAKVTLKKLGDGVEVVLSGDARPAGKLDVSYKQDFFAVQALVDSDGSKTTIVPSATIGHDGLSVGATASADAAGDLKDYNVGAEYAQPDFTLTLKTAKKGEEINASFFHKLSSATSVGTLFWHSPADDAKKLTVGVEHKYDAATSFKTKVDSSGLMGAAMEHRLPQGPLFGVAGTFNVLSKTPFAAQKMGLSLKFGDY